MYFAKKFLEVKNTEIPKSLSCERLVLFIPQLSLIETRGFMRIICIGLLSFQELKEILYKIKEMDLDFYRKGDRRSRWESQDEC